MNFEIDQADNLAVTDDELFHLLTHVYVNGGFTQSSDAESLFEANAVRERGTLICARSQDSALAGIIILVPFGSSACRLAQQQESEMQLLAVKSEFRNNGLGKLLVNELIKQAEALNYSKIVLWTQQSMRSAQALYQSVGFVHVENLEKNNRTFFVYNKNL